MELNFKLDLPVDTRLETGAEKDRLFDLVIIGGGPAGMTAAVYASRKQMTTALVSHDLGGQVLKTSGVENYLGYQYITGPELAGKFSQQIKQFPLKVLANEGVAALAQRSDNLFSVKTNAGRELTSRTLILATGKRWRNLPVPGAEEYIGRGVAFCSVCDAPFYRDQPVAIAGGGNSAVTAALDMLQVGGQVTLINSADGWQADPILLARVQKRVTLLDAHRVVEILGDGAKVTGVKVVPRDGGETRLLPVRGVFVEIGLLPNTEFFRDFVALNEQGEVIVDCASHTSRSGVYGAGDCTSVPEKQILIAAGDGAKAALAAYDYVSYHFKEE